MENPLKPRSGAITDGPSRAPARAMLKAVGFSDADLRKPIIGVANTWIEIGPCNYHLRTLAEHVKEGIRKAGGTPMEFNTVSISDGITMGSQGMKTSLISRDLIADSIELVARGNLFDGLIALSGCDKTIPGTIMALARLDIPGVMLYGGSIAPGEFHGKNITIQDVFEAVGAHAAGRMSDADLLSVENQACPGAGACGGQFTANTMSTVGEFLGISAMGFNDVPALDPEKQRVGREAGALVMDLLKRNMRPRQVITRDAIENAIASVAATGGSTNAVLHLLAIAREAGIELSIDDFDRISSESSAACRLEAQRTIRCDRYVQGGGRAVDRQAAERRGHPQEFGADGDRQDDRRGSRRRLRTERPGSRAAALESDEPERRPRDSARQPRARRRGRQDCRQEGADVPRHRAGVRHRRSGVRGGRQQPYQSGGYSRHPVRRPKGGQVCARCWRSRAPCRVRVWANRSPC